MPAPKPISTTPAKPPKQKTAKPLVILTNAGQQRTVIERVSPELDGGRFPIKAIPGDVIRVEADILADGHDVLAARLLHKHTAGNQWQETPMTLLMNDRWTGSFTVPAQGQYRYTIETWIDTIASWQHEIELKLGAGQRLTSELLAGAVLVEGMGHRAGGGPNANATDAAQLFRVAELFRTGADEINSDAYTEAIHIAESEQFTHWLLTYPDRQHVTRYSRELGVDVDRAKAGFSTWYCLFPRSASRVSDSGGAPAHGTFRDVEALLPRIASMGFDVLYLPPIHPIGTAHRKGKNNSVTCLPGEPGVPYGIGSELGGHDAILPELGTIDDFKHLVEASKTFGMEVAMDLAIQCSPDHPWAKDHPDWFKKRPDGTIQYAENPPKKYQDIYPVYFENDDWQNLWLELRRVLLTWGEWGIRMIRVDNPHTKPFRFWAWIIAEVRAVYPDMIFLSEAFTKPKVMQQLAKAGFAQSYTYYTWRNSKAELTEYLTELTTTEMQYYFRPNFWPTTHDINPPVLQSGHEPSFLTRFFMAATLSGNYGIFGPSFELMDHAQFSGKEEFLNSEKYEIRAWDWGKTNKLTFVITATNRARRENPALQQTNNLTFCRVDDDQLLAYLKSAGESTPGESTPGNNHILSVVNLDGYQRRAGRVQVPIWQLGIGPEQPYVVHDLITGVRYTWRGEWNYVELDPFVLPMHLLRIEV